MEAKLEKGSNLKKETGNARQEWIGIEEWKKEQEELKRELEKVFGKEEPSGKQKS